MMTRFFLSVLTISAAVSVPVILLIVSGPVLIQRYAAKWKYWIWLFLALRLLVSASGQMVGGLAADMAETRREAEESRRDTPTGAEPVIRRIVVDIPPQMTAPVLPDTGKNNPGISILDILAAVWLAGGLLFLLVHLCSYGYFRKRLMKTGRPAEDERAMKLLASLSEAAGIKRKVTVVECPDASGPMTTGFFTSMIILPTVKYSDEELYFIFKHELFHIKRRDVRFQFLLVAANAVHWFNPVIWLMQREAVVDMELSCDEWVVRGKGKSVRTAYTEVLFSALHKKYVKRIPFSTQFYEGKKIMKKRFQNILNRKKKKNGIFVQATTEGRAENEPEEGEAEESGVATLTVSREGEAEELPAALFIGGGYSLYLTEGNWQQTAADEWVAVYDGTPVLDGQVRLRIQPHEGRTLDEVREEMESGGYEQEDYSLARREGDMVYRIRLLEDGSRVWEIFYCYTAEAEEGWGQVLRAMADTFSVSPD